jgi:hypothetical protein
MMNLSARAFLKNLSNIPGWKTRRQLVVFESDDWGSIRMPSLKSFERLDRLGLDLRSADAARYNLNDNLATGSDLEGLFEVLSRVKDRSGRNAVFTPVSIVANPDFQKIRESGFRNYSYEPFTETLKRFPGCGNSFELWKEGIRKELFVPQMHGREHLNVMAWMKDLKAGEKLTRAAFEEGMWGFVPPTFPDVDYQAAFLLTDPGDLEYHREVIREGLQLFEQLFGYRAVFFVPPNGLFHNSLNRTLAENGITLRYVSKIQHEPLGMGRLRKVYHYHGQTGNSGIRYIIRNCFFEPSQEGKDWVDSCLNDMRSAFRLNKPAIIGTHRVNYTGSLNPKNRDLGLAQLSLLLKEILRNWPDAEFMTTARLGALMNEK